MYKDAFDACFIDNPDVCTAFLSWGFTDKYTWQKDGKFPLFYTDDYVEKPAYDAMLDSMLSIEPEPEEYATDDLHFTKLANGKNWGQCVDCDGDVGECRRSWPRGDPDRN